MNLNRLIIKPVITERSLAAATNNQYTFLVDPRSNKDQIKQAVEQQFKVQVVQVNTLRQKPTIKRTGRRRLKNRTALTKKAIVTLRTGNSIPVFEA